MRNHLRKAIAIDFAVVSTVTFGHLCVFVVLGLERRRLFQVHVTSHPTAAWTAQQMIEALPEETGLRYVIRDRDAMLRNGVPAAGCRHGSGRGSDRSALALAKCLCGAVRRVLAPRVLGSHDRSEQAAGLPDRLEPCPLLQTCANPSGPCEGCSRSPERPIASERAGRRIP